MVDRRLVTDIGLALLIAFPAILPAAPSPWSVDTRVGYPAPEATKDSTDSSDTMAEVGQTKWESARPDVRS